jgi:hypothetical protein
MKANPILRALTKKVNIGVTMNPTKTWLNKEDLSKLYLKFPDGIRRA